MLLGGIMGRNVYADRFMGYKQALQDHNINFDETLLIISKLNEEGGNQAAAQIIQMAGLRPDAVFSANDTAAVHCMIKLKETGIRIPADIAFAGFNNDTISKIIEPNLTTINYSGYEMGQAAATSLINHLTGVSKKNHQHHYPSLRHNHTAVFPEKTKFADVFIFAIFM